MFDTQDGRTCKIIRTDVHLRYSGGTYMSDTHDGRTSYILRTDIHVRSSLQNTMSNKELFGMTCSLVPQIFFQIILGWWVDNIGVWSTMCLPTIGLTLRMSLLTLPEHLSSPPVFSGIPVTRSLVLYICFVDRCLSFCTFSFGHCGVCYSSIYEFWLFL